MTILARQRQLRGQPISAGGWGGWMSDPAAIPPNSVYATSAAGTVVNERTVMSLMVVASCIRVLGDGASGLNVHVYRQKGKQRNPSIDKEVEPPDVVIDPYAEISRKIGDFALVASLGLAGNLYKHVVDRDDKGNPLQIEILNPNIVKVERVKGVKTYKLGAIGAEIPAADMVHVPWEYLPGALVGMNPIEACASGFGQPLAEVEYSGRFFSQGMHPTGILSIEKPTRENDMERIQQELMVKHGGLSQAFTPIVLDAATKWQQITVNPETAQLLQSRAFSRGEIAGFYGVPPHLVGDNSGSGGPWGKGLQELVMGFAMFSLKGYTERLDESDTKLLPPGYYAKRNVDDLFKTNSQMLGQYIAMLRNSSVATPNEARAMVGLPPVDEPYADSLFAPVNSSHSDWLSDDDESPERGLPGGENAKGQPGGGGGKKTPAGSDATDSASDSSPTQYRRRGSRLLRP